MKGENKTVTIIVRETIENKAKIWNLAKLDGFDKLSDFIRTKWREWL